MSLFASVILPTHDRACTLPFAIQSVLNQTERDIELIIVGDGCTEEVRKICLEWSDRDARVVFLDLPKAANRGAANRDLAVRSARSNRIFYIDDDDLFLPHHIETLGAELDKLDVVDTPAISIGPEGGVSLGIINSGNPLMKKLLIEEKFKGVFDTHLAHTKDIYLRHSGAWLSASDHRVVLHMLKTFATDEVRWETRLRITALSFHGIRRVTMSDAGRARELESWSERLSEPELESELQRKGDYGHHIWSLLCAIGDDDRPFSTSGISFDQESGAISIANENTNQQLKLVERQADSIGAIIRLASRQSINKDNMALLADLLLRPHLGPAFFTLRLLREFKFHFSDEEIAPYLDEKKHWMALGAFVLRIRSGVDTAYEQVQKFILSLPDYDAFFGGLVLAQVYKNAGKKEMAHKVADLLRDKVPNHPIANQYWTLMDLLE